jgi:hypothetical protein
MASLASSVAVIQGLAEEATTEAETSTATKICFLYIKSLTLYKILLHLMKLSRGVARSKSTPESMRNKEDPRVLAQ